MEGSASVLCSQLPPGFRFHPTDQELIIHYLRKKIASSLPPSSSIIAEVDLYKFNPWDLPEKAFFGEGEWFFFSPRDRKYPNGVRPNRAAACGYWKATGTDKPILAANGSHCLGVKKALVFYKGRPPKGIKSDWVMNEYRLLDSSSSMSHKLKGTMRLDDWVLCRVRHKAILAVEHDAKPAPLPPLVTSAFTKSQSPFERQQLGRNEQSSLFEINEGQLMGYLLGSASQDESAGESSELCHGGGLFMGEQQQRHHPELVTSTQSSIERKHSFGTLDELMMLHQSKRLHHYTARGQPSPAGSDSVDQECLEFLI